MSIKEYVKKIVFGKRYSSESYITYLRNIGVEIGEDVVIYVPTKTLIDEQYPWLIKIGNHVRITEGVKILSHDYSWSVLKCNTEDSNMTGAILGSSGKVKIGDNVFVGMNSVITCGVTIGNNVIIGAGSVVTHDCEKNNVYAGVPAQKIMTITEFYEKRVNSQLAEATMIVKMYFEKYGRVPPIDTFHEYFYLFEQSDTAVAVEKFKAKMELGTGIEDSISYMNHYNSKFKSYEEFIEYSLK